jgi:type VI secretion system protein ImpE
MNSKELFQAGRLADAIKALGAELREIPSDTRRRTFLFELLCFAGVFDRAEKHLDILAGAGQDASLGALLYRAALNAERTRADLFQKRDYPSTPAPAVSTSWSPSPASRGARPRSSWKRPPPPSPRCARPRSDT